MKAKKRHATINCSDLFQKLSSWYLSVWTNVLTRLSKNKKCQEQPISLMRIPFSNSTNKHAYLSSINKDYQNAMSRKHKYVSKRCGGASERVKLVEEVTFWICSVVMFVGGNEGIIWIICCGCCILFLLPFLSRS